MTNDPPQIPPLVLQLEGCRSRLHLLASNPVLLSILELDEGDQHRALSTALFPYFTRYFSDMFPPARGVSIDRLDTVLATGCDVEPSIAPFFVGDVEKALNYGDNNRCGRRILLFFAERHLEPTWREIPADSPPDEIAQLRQCYPTVLTSVSGEKLWFSRFPEGAYAASGYEVEHGRWIPGDPWRALRGIFVIGTEATQLTRQVKEAASRTKVPWHWRD